MKLALLFILAAITRSALAADDPLTPKTADNLPARMDKDRAADVIWIPDGVVLSRFPEGVLVESKILGQKFLITGLPDASSLTDGAEIAFRVKISKDKFEYKGVDAGLHTVHKFAYVAGEPGDPVK